MRKEILIEKVRKIAGYREKKILAQLTKIEKIDNYDGFGARFYDDKGNYFEVAEIDGELLIVG